MISSDLSLLFDYAPIFHTVSKSAYFVYTAYLSLMDDDGKVQLSYQELGDHFPGLSSSTISRANQLLQELDLIEIKQVQDDAISTWNYNVYIVKQPVALSDEKRKELYEKYKVEQTGSTLRERFLSIYIPKDIRQLLNVQLMSEQYKLLGPEQFTVEKLAKAFKLDLSKLKACLINQEFKSRLLAVKQRVIDLNNPQRGRPKSVYEKCVRDAQETKDLSKWTTHHLFGYFLIRYQQRYGARFCLSANQFNCKELRDFKLMLDKLGSTKLAKQYIDWVFDVKVNLNAKGVRTLDGLERTGILAHHAMLNEFNRRKQDGTLEGQAEGLPTHAAPIDESFIEWTKQNVPSILKLRALKTYDDLYWLVEASADKKNEDLQKLVTEGRKRKLIPETGNIKFADRRR